MLTRVVLAVAVFLLSLASRPCLSQCRPAPVAFEATFGVSTGVGGEYRDRSQRGARLALSGRAWHSPRLALHADVAKEVLGITSGHTSICQLTVTGGCARIFPELAGYSALVGIVALPLSHLELGADIGGATVASLTRHASAFVGQASIAPVIGQHVAVVLLVRKIVIPDYDGQRLTMTPVQIGLRVR